jgi:hypothetical protein
MQPVDYRSGRMLQRNSAPSPLKLNAMSHDNVDPKSRIQSRIDDLPVQQPKSQSNKINHHPLFSSNFNFAAGGAAPSPPPSAGLPHTRPRGPRSKSPSSRNSMIEDEDSEWDATKELPHFQATIRRPSLLTPPTTSDSRRQSYDRTTHLGYDDGSSDLLPPGRRSSVPTHHLRPEPSPEGQAHAGFRRSSLATTSITRQDVEDERKYDVETLSEVDSAEEELAADNTDIEGVQVQTAELKLDDSKPPTMSLKRESEDSDPSIYSEVNTPIPNPFASLNNVPYPYIHKRLLDLGPYFVGHEATAQVYVEAIPMNEKDQLYKVEIVPRDTESVPFRLVKRSKYNDSSDESDGTPPPDSPVTPYDIDDDEVEYTSPTLPIHVEYAVFRLPLLGSMLLSGQVFCGDTLKIPLPYPEVWTAVVGWMYTNKVVRLPGLNVHEQAEMVRDCIEFLGGRV